MSSPYQIGQIHTAADGTIEFSITLPADAGLHRVLLYAKPACDLPLAEAVVQPGCEVKLVLVPLEAKK